jgi:uncharacterized protein (DUF362 family)
LNIPGFIHSLKRRLFRPAVLRRLVREGTLPPRVPVRPRASAETIVLTDLDDPGEAFRRIGDLWDERFAGLLLPHHDILIKINLNTADPYPASTDPRMLAALVRFLRARNCGRRIRVGDCSSVRSLPTLKVARKTGILDALSGTAAFISFDDGPWVSVPVPGRFLREITVPRAAMEADRVLFLANMKTHNESDFSLGMKLAVGLLHPLERYALHRDRLREKIAELVLAVPPDLTIIDGRTAFVTGGPDRGETARCGAVILGTDVVRADLAAYGVLAGEKRRRGRTGGFTGDPFGMAQFAHAERLGLAEPPEKTAAERSER